MKIDFTKVLHRSFFLVALCLAACGTVNTGGTSAAGTPAFIPTGSLATARYNHTATLLPNGKVLVSGGRAPNNWNDFYANGNFSSAELYDPTTGMWNVTGSLAAARSSHTATLLANGKVLVVGGLTSSVEIYDPVTGGWTATGSLVTARVGYTATLLPNGKVLVSGGFNTAVGVLASTVLYDPSTETWKEAGSLATARYGHAATLLPNGKVLVSGGRASTSYEQVNFSSAELYDSATGAWTTTGSLMTARYHHTTTLLPNGNVLVSGGTGKVPTTTLNRILLGDSEFTMGPLSSGELYDTNKGTWSTTGALATAREGHTATLLPNGTVLVCGGAVSSGTPGMSRLGELFLYQRGAGSLFTTFASAELYDPTTGVWEATAPLTVPRDAHAATLLQNGKVLISGGLNEDGYPASTELYEVHP